MTIEALKDIASEASVTAERFATNHNSITKRELTPIYEAIGSLAKLSHANQSALQASVADLLRRVEQLEEKSRTRSTPAAQSLWCRFVKKLKSNVPVIP